ncbi:hypothetical protein DYY65_01410 [Nitrososphaera sp. AFS]|nr:hypothetical protein [Nitrososphaera sp. AFS]
MTFKTFVIALSVHGNSIISDYKQPGTVEVEPIGRYERQQRLIEEILGEVWPMRIKVSANSAIIVSPRIES